jgi:hypothetical protein
MVTKGRRTVSDASTKEKQQTAGWYFFPQIHLFKQSHIKHFLHPLPFRPLHSKSQLLFPIQYSNRRFIQPYHQ